MDYNSIEEIFSAGVENMTILRNNTRQDEGTDTITGIPWFSFNGTVTSAIYVNGNSWIGFGSPNEHLKVNCRDGSMYYLYREEGTLFGYHNFLKIRWSGFSHYAIKSENYKIEYDVILWDTGDISLHMISIPTRNNTGTYSFVTTSTYPYTVSTASPDVTFKKTDSGFEVQNAVIELELPFEQRYLVRSGSTIYTVLDGELFSLGNTTITPALFLNSGVEDIPDLSLLSNLYNPELLYWHEIEDDITGLTVKGTPILP